MCKNRLLDDSDVKMILVARSRDAAAPARPGLAAAGQQAANAAASGQEAAVVSRRDHWPRGTGRSAVNAAPAPPDVLERGSFRSGEL